MGRKKKVEDEEIPKFIIVDADDMKESGDEDCMNCPCHRVVDIDNIPEDILDRLDPDYIKPRLGFDSESKKIIITTVLDLCRCDEGDLDELDEEDSETLKLGDATIILP